MYRPAIMGLLFCASILLGSVLYLYVTQAGAQEKTEKKEVLLDLEFDEDDLEDLKDLDKYWKEFDCELLREKHGWSTSDQTH